MKEQRFPSGWDEERVRRVLDHYERQSEEEAVAEDEAAYEQDGQSMVEVPCESVPKVRDLIAQHQPQRWDSQKYRCGLREEPMRGFDSFRLVS